MILLVETLQGLGIEKLYCHTFTIESLTNPASFPVQNLFQYLAGSQSLFRF